MLAQVINIRAQRGLEAAAVAGLFIGLLMLLFCAQLYQDYRDVLSGKHSSERQYVTLSKPVSLLGALGVRNVFSEAEIAELSAQPFTEDVGRFASNAFKAGANSPMLGFYTELFFESVPSRFLDVDSSDFRWRAGGREVPIVIPRDYLALYNFGFAPSRGLPQVTPSTLSKFSLDLILSGNGLRQTYQGRIVGFSDRINTILVPQDFLAYANGAFGNGRPTEVSRLIVQVGNPYDKAFQSFIKTKGYETGGSKVLGGRTALLVNSLLGIIALVGGLIVLLALLVFVLHYRLRIQAAADNIQKLLYIGYAPRVLSRFLQWRYALLLFALVLPLVLLALHLARHYVRRWVQNSGFQLAEWPAPATYALALGIFALLYAINHWAIGRQVAKLGR